MSRIRRRPWSTKSGNKSICWEVDFKDSNGKRIRKSGFKTKVEAEEYLLEVQISIKSGSFKTKNEKMTFAEACKTYMELQVMPNCKRSTIMGYKGYLKHHLLPYFGNVKLINISQADIERFIKVKVDKGLSNQSINHFLILINAIFKKMVDYEIIFKNPVSKVKKRRVLHKEKRILDFEEVKTILNITREEYPDFYPLLFTAIFTGARRGELVALTWNKINFETNQIKIDSNYTKGGLTTPKTCHSIREINLPKKLVKILKEWKLRCPHSDKNLVFPNQDGNYLDADNMIKRKFKPVLKKAGIEGICWHSLRHTYVSLLISQNAHPRYIQNQVGHGSINVTMDTYGHIMRETIQQGIDALDNLFCEAS